MYIAHICAEALPTSLPQQVGWAKARSCAPCPPTATFGGHASLRFAHPTTHHPPPRTLARGQLFLLFLEKLVLGHFLFAHIGELNDEVHHLFLKNRRPHTRERIVIFLVVVPHFPLAPGILPRPVHYGPRYFIVIDLDVVLIADFRKHKAEAYPPVGYGTVLFAILFLGRAFL